MREGRRPTTPEERAAVEAEVASWGAMSDEQWDTLLWCGTAFPCADTLHVVGQLAELRRLSGGNWAGAVSLANLTQAADELLYHRPALPASTEAS